MRNTYAVPAARSLVTKSNLGQFYAANSQLTIAAAIKEVWTAYNANDHGFNDMLWFATANADYYGVRNCRSVETPGTDEFCASKTTSARLLAYVKNFAAFRDNKTHVYEISDKGDVTKLVGVTKDDLDVLGSDWFRQTNGWVSTKTTGLTPRLTTFSVSIPRNSTNDATSVGVAGATRIRSEPCFDACLESSYGIAAAHAFAIQSVDFMASANATTMVKGVKLLWQAFKDSDHGDNVQLMFQLAGGDYYAILNCWLPGNYNNTYCAAAGRTTWTIAYVYAQQVSAKVRVYSLTNAESRDGALNGDINVLLGEETLTQDRRASEWYPPHPRAH